MRVSTLLWGRIRAWLLQPHTSTWFRLSALQFHVFFRLQPISWWFGIFFPSSFMPPIIQAASNPLVETQVRTNGCDFEVVSPLVVTETSLVSAWGDVKYWQNKVHLKPSCETQWPTGCIHTSCGLFYQKLRICFTINVMVAVLVGPFRRPKHQYSCCFSITCFPLK